MKKLIAKCLGLYTPEVVYDFLVQALNTSFDRFVVDEMIFKVDEFDAGAVDVPLQRHIFDELEKMRITAKVKNTDKLALWKERLGLK